jgi:hypothetical protein
MRTICRALTAGALAVPMTVGAAATAAADAPKPGQDPGCIAVEPIFEWAAPDPDTEHDERFYQLRPVSDNYWSVTGPLSADIAREWYREPCSSQYHFTKAGQLDRSAS